MSGHWKDPNVQVYPYKFQPVYKERIWGGRNLERLFGRVLPAGQKIGESWELADLPGGVSTVSNGPQAGATLTELTVRGGHDLLGRTKVPPERFPLLLKLLDADDILSLQVHPDARAAAEIGGGAAPKTECWYVVQSRGGFIYKGLMPGVTLLSLRAAAQRDDLASLVRRVEVSEGDFHYLPAGIVHGLGGGVVVAEVQTPSDTTYRLSDWGRGRPIHVEESLRCVRPELTGDDPPGAGGETLLATEFFAVLRRKADGAAAVPEGRCTALMVLRGAGRIVHAGQVEKTVPVRAGETVLLPAALGGVSVVPETSLEWLQITLPEN
jgi:mannose-6-phosphate isomerase